MSEKLDTVVLATGDGDFVPLVEYLRYSQGCQVEVISFGKSASGQLREATDDFIDMCDNPRQYLINYRGGGGRGFNIPGFRSIETPSSSEEEGIDVGEEIYDDSDPDTDSEGK
jgi:hypothetical protein